LVVLMNTNYFHILITGGAGFIGCNSAAYFLEQGKYVTIIDNFSRDGSKKNLAWLQSVYKKKLTVIESDVRHLSAQAVQAIQTADLILHLAGQVAVTTSVQNPQEDFAINTQGTLNVLEIARQNTKNPIFIYASTNKVYGELEKESVREEKTRYIFTKIQGIAEKQQIDFHSPYGCSKGSADQYVRDYARIYNMNTIVFRQSCIYGPHQYGMEDQGWIAWFLIAILQKKPITIYGNGKQVRDVLYIDDLVRAYDLAAQHIQKTRGKIYNIGGGLRNSLSIWKECQPIFEKLVGHNIDVQYASARPGDQRMFISDIRKAYKDFGWKPQVKVKAGIRMLYDWIYAHCTVS